METVETVETVETAETVETVGAVTPTAAAAAAPKVTAAAGMGAGVMANCGCENPTTHIIIRSWLGFLDTRRS